MVRTWLDQADAEQLDKLAASRGIDVSTLIADAIYPLIDAEPDESVWPVAMSVEDEKWLRREIADLCSGEADVDIDDEIYKWIRVYVRDGVERGREIII
jgi:hypothetical protein